MHLMISQKQGVDPGAGGSSRNGGYEASFKRPLQTCKNLSLSNYLDVDRPLGETRMGQTERRRPLFTDDVRGS